MNFSSADSWSILSAIEQSIREKIMAAGTPLKEWDVHINYGIKTGLNDAFIIDSATRDALIAADPKSAEIIRPILRGRDIKRYEYSSPELWLLYVPWHFPIEDENSIVGASERAEQLFQDQYPAVYAHLVSYKEKLFERNKAETGIRYEWYALQRWGANYRDDFSKQKIVWGELSDNPKFALDKTGKYVPLNTTFLMTGENLEYLMAFLNSPVSKYFFSTNIATTSGVGTIRWLKYTIETLPIPRPSSNELQRIKLLVNSISDDGVGIGQQEELDQIVYSLYGFNEEEIECIKGYCGL